MFKEEFRPTKPFVSNTTYKGFETDSPAVEGGRVKDLLVLDNGSSIFSVWKIANVWHRIKFVFHGTITLQVLGARQPPVSLLINDETKRQVESVYGGGR